MPEGAAANEYLFRPCFRWPLTWQWLHTLAWLYAAGPFVLMVLVATIDDDTDRFTWIALIFVGVMLVGFLLILALAAAIAFVAMRSVRKRWFSVRVDGETMSLCLDGEPYLRVPVDAVELIRYHAVSEAETTTDDADAGGPSRGMPPGIGVRVDLDQLDATEQQKAALEQERDQKGFGIVFNHQLIGTREQAHDLIAFLEQNLRLRVEIADEPPRPKLGRDFWAFFTFATVIYAIALVMLIGNATGPT